MSREQTAEETQVFEFQTLYIDPFAGAAGDMINAALVDLGVSLKPLQTVLKGLGYRSLSARCEITQKQHLRAAHFIVSAEEADIPEYLSLQQLRNIFAAAAVSEQVRERAQNILSTLASGESRAHGVPPEEVHFHELGGLDTVVDVLGACIGFAAIAPKNIYVGPLPAQRGAWKMSHGMYPLPAPVTLEIIAQAGLFVQETSEVFPPDIELVTPTGAALLAEFAKPGSGTMQVQRIGYGAGTRDLPAPNILRIWAGK